jgi:hypothetical protein
LPSTRTLIHDPCGPTGRPAAVTAPRLGSLSGRRIAVLDNGKPNAALLMSEMARLLAERTGADASLMVAKRTAAEPAADEILKELAAQADLVITGTADCGSCTAWSVHDLVTLEGLGTPTITVTTTAFEPIAREAAATLGFPGARLAVLPHPIGGIVEDDVRQRARGSIEQLLELAVR